MKKQTQATVSSIARPTLADYAGKFSNAPSFIKSGQPNVDRNDGALELDTVYSGTITDARVQSRANNGTPQLVLGFTADTGEVTSIGLDLPFDETDSIQFGLSAEEYETYAKRAGTRMHRFLSAAMPETFQVWASVDKSNPTKWVYLDASGAEMSASARATKSKAVELAIMGISDAAREGNFAPFLDAKVNFVRATNKNSADFPYSNFSVYGDN